MYICMLCSSARGTGGLLYNHPINWFGSCPDGPPEECPTCGSSLGILPLTPEEPAAVAMACEVLEQQRARIAELEARAGQASVLPAWAARGWVDVAVDEPPEGVHVLTLTADGETQILYLDDDGDWYSAMTGSWWDGSPVEMWHDLPDLPSDPGDVERADDADDL